MGLPLKTTWRLQVVQNMAKSAVISMLRYTQSSWHLLLCKLYWLLDGFQGQFEIAYHTARLFEELPIPSILSAHLMRLGRMGVLYVPSIKPRKHAFSVTEHHLFIKIKCTAMQIFYRLLILPIWAVEFPSSCNAHSNSFRWIIGKQFWGFLWFPQNIQHMPMGHIDTEVIKDWEYTTASTKLLREMKDLNIFWNTYSKNPSWVMHIYTKHFHLQN